MSSSRARARACGSEPAKHAHCRDALKISVLMRETLDDARRRQEERTAARRGEEKKNSGENAVKREGAGAYSRVYSGARTRRASERVIKAEKQNRVGRDT